MVYLHKDAMEENSKEGKWQFKRNGKLGRRTSKARLVRHEFMLKGGISFVSTRAVNYLTQSFSKNVETKFCSYR